MILLAGSILISIIVGIFIGYLIGSHGSKVIDGSIQDVKDKVDEVHNKAESIKDDLAVIENIVSTVKDVVPESAKKVIADDTDILSSKAIDFVEEQIKELDKFTAKDKEDSPVAGDVKAGGSSNVVASTTVEKPHGIVAG